MFLTRFRASSKAPTASTVAGVRIVSSGHAGSTLIQLSGLGIGDSYTIGRAERCDITIYDESVSRMHCRIERLSTGALAIIDQGSRNGVRFARLGPGDARVLVQSAELCLGSHVYLGDTVVVPVDEHARVPIVARRLTEFIRNAGGVYGPGSILQRMVGLRRSLMARIVGSQRAVR